MAKQGNIEINPIQSEENLVDMITHPVNVERLAKHITTLMKWKLLPQLSKRGVTLFEISS